MTNLLQETISILEHNGKTQEDVLWVGDTSKKTTWENFERISNFEYDSGYGGTEIERSLLIVGDTWWLERGEYDGSEWWEFKEHPSCDSSTFTKLLDVRENWTTCGLDWENEYET